MSVFIPDIDIPRSCKDCRDQLRTTCKILADELDKLYASQKISFVDGNIVEEKPVKDVFEHLRKKRLEGCPLSAVPRFYTPVVTLSKENKVEAVEAVPVEPEVERSLISRTMDGVETRLTFRDVDSEENKGKEGKISSNWQTGTPTEEGLYLLYVEEIFGDKGVDSYIVSSWINDMIGFDFLVNSEAEKAIVIAWQKIEPYKEAGK